MTDPCDMPATILETVHRQLGIDHPWSVHHDDAFTWWPGGGVRQRVRAEGPIAVDGVDTWWLAIETPVWRAPDDAALLQLAGAIERLRVRAHGAAVVVDQEARGVSLAMRTYLLPETVPGRCYALAGLGPVQARQALAAWSHAESTLGPDASAWRDALPHPVGGERRLCDEILDLPEALLHRVSDQLGPTGLLDAWRQTADALRHCGLDAPVRQDDTLLTYVTRCGDHDARILLGLMHDDLTGPAVAVSTLLEVPADEASARATCDALQRAALTPPSLVWTLGSWVLRPSVAGGTGLTAMHTAFLPVGLFPFGYGVPLAHAVAQQLRVWGEVLEQRSRASARDLDRHGQLDAAPRSVARQRRTAERERQAETRAVTE